LENVSKGGNFLLNVGPDGTGTIPPKSVENLLAVGEWLKVNGDAIYGTNPWKVTHEGPTGIAIKGTEHRNKHGFKLDVTSEDFWFTKKGDTLYVSAMSRPEGNTVLIKSLKGLPISGISVLGETGNIQWLEKEDGIEVTLPAFQSKGMGYALEISV
jgi:alpha-L-fucosidase